MKQVITLAQLNATVAQGHTVEAVLASYDCPEYVQAQAAAQVQAAPQVAVAGGGGAFNLLAFAQTQVASASSAKRAPHWEVPVEELRKRVIIRDVQTPQKKDEANAKLRIQLAPQYVDLKAYGTMPDGSKIVHFVVPRAQEEAAKAKLLADVMSGMHDDALLAAAAACKGSAEKKKANASAKKAPQDAQMAADAIKALESATAPTLAVAGGGVSLEQQLNMAVAPEQSLLGGITLPTL